MGENDLMQTVAAGAKEEGAKKPARRGRGCLIYLLNFVAMGIVVLLLMVGLTWGLNAYTHHGEAIVVPDLKGKNYTDAIRMADAQGLVVVANDSTYIKEMAAGCVVLQQPTAGSNVKEGHTIYVTINSYTLPRVEIPDLIDNSSYREAQAKLQALDFVVLPPKLVEGEKDWVYGIQCDGRNLSTGDMVAKESHLTLVIGNGLVGEDAEIEEFMEEYTREHSMEEMDDMEEVPETDLPTE